MTDVRSNAPRRRAMLSASTFALGAAVSTLACAQPAQPETAVDELVVTASRVERDGFAAPTPTTVLSAAELRKTGATTVAGVMAQIPAFQPTTSAASTNLSSQNAGGAFINLRNLGNNRTLVLVDGRRFVPTTADGIVDTNVIPASLLERVEVVTGGASAAWGSDAVAGVVNLILRQNLQGLEGQVSYGQAEESDNQNYQASLAYGARFAGGRGRLMLAGEFDQNRGVNDAQDRKWARGYYGILTNPAYTAANGQFRQLIVPNFQLANATEGGLIVSGPLAGTDFGPGGVPRAFTYGAYVGSYMSGGSGVNSGRYIPLKVPVERKTAYGRASYDLTDAVTGFVEGSYGRSRALSDGIVQPFDLGNLTISVDNAYLPAAVRSQLAALGQTSFRFGRLDTDFGFMRADVANETTRFVAGLNGKLGQGWKWNGYVERGRTEYDAKILNNRINARYALAVDSVINPATGQAACRSTLTNPTNGCVPINLFGYGAPSAQALAYISGTQQLLSIIRQTAAAASLQGEPFSTWAGPVSLVLGGEYRKESVDATADPVSQASGFIIGNPKSIAGSYDVREAFAEVVAPLVQGAALAKSVDFNGALRFTDYSTSGTIAAWKAGLSWTVNDDWRLRATRSRDIRAPTLNELYASSVLNFATITNSRTGVQTVVQQLTSGNANLDPEKADTWTAGVVFQPAGTGWSLSMDGYDISVDGAIATLTSQDTFNRCQAGLTALCSLISTDASGLPTQIRVTQINLTKLKTRGVDLEAGYRTEVAALAGSLTFRALLNYVDKLEKIDGATRVDQAGEVGYGTFGNNGLPHWRGSLSATLERGPWTAYLAGRYVGGGKYNKTYGPLDISDNTISHRVYVDASVQYDLLDERDRAVSLYLSVNNLLDRDPPIDPQNFFTPNQTNPVLYDVVGRTLSAGVRFRYR